MHAPATGLIAASACHRTALAQRAAVSGLPPGAPGTAGSVSLRRGALVRRREALLALRSQACAAREATPSLESIEAALAPLLASIFERTANEAALPPPAAPSPPVLWEVSAAVQGALQDEAQGPDPDAPTLAAPAESAEGTAATAAAAPPRPPPPGASGAAAEGGDAPPCELRAQLTSLHAQLAAARRELIARLCCRLQRGWEELDSTDTRLIVLVTSQAAQALIASAPLAAPVPNGTAGTAGAAAGAAADTAGVGGEAGAAGVGGVGVGGVGGVGGVVSSCGAAGAAEAVPSTAQAATSSVVDAEEASLLEEASHAQLVRVGVGD